MKYTIVSTYPAEGSKNIGDGLITSSTINAIERVKGKENVIQSVWKQAPWEDVKEKVLESDVVIFACLSIRKNMDVKIYTYLQELLDSNIPIGVVSAGTSLDMNNKKDDIFSGFPPNVLRLLKEFNERSLFFTTRGFLTQSFCNYHGLDNMKFSGDIAFYDERFTDRKFERNHEIKKIAISDPHYAKAYIKSMDLLYSRMSSAFPAAEITFLIHGVNPRVEKFCKEKKIKYEKLYLDKHAGLDTYDSFDLHVGYRVHGHVSTLKRRKPSYLLEQDGRGADYGLTLERKITVGHFFLEKTDLNLKNGIKKLIGRKIIPSKSVHLDPVYQVVAMIEEDAKTGFEKFMGLEKQMLEFNNRCLAAIEKLP